jgi:hypothetical protein
MFKRIFSSPWTWAVLCPTFEMVVLRYIPSTIAKVAGCAVIGLVALSMMGWKKGSPTSFILSVLTVIYMALIFMAYAWLSQSSPSWMGEGGLFN